jgi:3-(3-hydroxy-phenyl)propionate hydroxylase
VGPRRSLAGRLCPNATLPDGTRLDDTSHRGFLLVTTVEPTTTQQRELALRGVRLVRATAGSQLDAWLSSGHATCALVRPDFTVMQSGRGLAATCAAAATVGAAWADSYGQVRATTSHTQNPRSML